jgi:hypothetical protein
LPVAVDNNDLVVERGAEAGVLFAVDADIGSHMIAAADLLPPPPKAYPVVGHAATNDGNQPTAAFEPQKSLLDVPCSEGRAMSDDSAPGGRKWWIHYDGMISFVEGEKIVEAFGIECRRLESLQCK